MKLTPVGTAPAVSTGGAGSAAPAAAVAAALPAVTAPEVQVGAQTTRIQAAQQQLAALPEIDAARVAEIKDALARGEITFDPRKLAGLVVRHHGGRG